MTDATSATKAPSPAPVVPASELVKGTSLWRDAMRRLVKNRAAMAGAFVVVVLVILVLAADWISANVTHFSQQETHLRYAAPLPPGARSVPAEYRTWLPADPYGFAFVDANSDGEVTARELRTALQRVEFEHRDTDGNGTLSPDEYHATPHGLQGLEGKFSAIDLDASGVIEFEESTDLVTDILPLEEAQALVRQYDTAPDRHAPGYQRLSPGEFPGVPEPYTHMLGTDDRGRDLLTRLLHGGRISLMVGIAATLVSLLIGVSWGAIAGFAGGRVDSVMMRFVDVMYGLPFMFLVIMLVVAFGRDIVLLFIALGAVQWLTMARIVRGQVISLKHREFVLAARSIGTSRTAIIFRHLVPNALGPIIVYATLLVPAVMLEEAFLSFLGLGVQAPYASWGSLANEGRAYMTTHSWLIIWPGIALAMTLLSLNFLGDGLRDALDPQMKKD